MLSRVSYYNISEYSCHVFVMCAAARLDLCTFGFINASNYKKKSAEKKFSCVNGYKEVMGWGKIQQRVDYTVASRTAVQQQVKVNTLYTVTASDSAGRPLSCLDFARMRTSHTLPVKYGCLNPNN